MNKLLFLAALVASLSGCSLIPHKVEYFQKKVTPLPVKTTAQVDTEKQAVAFIADKTEQVVTNAIADGCTNVIAAATEANTAADALSRSVGPPANPWKGTADALAARLDKLEAKLDSKIKAYGAKVEPLAGKKIEGTGLFQIGYFTQWGIILGAVLLIWAGLKAYGLFNPVVGLGMNIAGRVSSTVLGGAFSQVVKGGEKFKEYLESSPLSDKDKETVADIFSRAHMETQTPAVQNIIQTLTK